jgi:hypothetical protein
LEPLARADDYWNQYSSRNLWASPQIIGDEAEHFFTKYRNFLLFNETISKIKALKN